MKKQSVCRNLNRLKTIIIITSRKELLTEQILQQDSVSRAQQSAQDKRSYQGSQEALSIMEKKVGDLIVRAPVDGQLTSLDAEIGQNKNPGQRLGQIDVLSGFKVRVNVDEHYLSPHICRANG